MQIIDKDIKQDWPQYCALGSTTCDWLPTGLNSIHRNPLDLTSQPFFYPVKSTFIFYLFIFFSPLKQQSRCLHSFEFFLDFLLLERLCFFVSLLRQTRQKGLCIKPKGQRAVYCSDKPFYIFLMNRCLYMIGSLTDHQFMIGWPFLCYIYDTLLLLAHLAIPYLVGSGLRIFPGSSRIHGYLFNANVRLAF